MAGVALAVLFSVSFGAGIEAPPAAALRHVRSSDARVRAFVDCGYDQSSAFRSIVDAVEAASVIVYIEQAVKLGGGRDGELLHTVTGSRELPILRVLIKTNLGSARAIAIIAHELQHVIESVGGGLEDAQAMTAMFARLDRARGDGANVYETEAAQKLQARVLEGLRGSGRCDVKRK